MDYKQGVWLVLLLCTVFTACMGASKTSASKTVEGMDSKPVVNAPESVVESEPTRVEKNEAKLVEVQISVEKPQTSAKSLVIRVGEKKMDGKIAVLETTLGTIEIELYDNMPITAGNFKKLVSEGFYDGVIFHRIIAGFMVQGGDPQGTGMGGPGYTIKDEFAKPNKNDRGTISMANAGPNTGGSQFFLNLVNNNFLDDKHPVFGKITKGMDVLDKLGAVKVGANDRPIQEVKIIKATLR